MPEKSREHDSETLSKPLRRWRKAGDLEDLRMRCWRAVRAAEQVLYDERSTRGEVLKAATILHQAARSYLKVLEADELEERIKALEEAMQAKQNGTYHYH